jgi:gamma-glutamyltranspeptidase / glutathione hydrolase
MLESTLAPESLLPKPARIALPLLLALSAVSCAQKSLPTTIAPLVSPNPVAAKHGMVVSIEKNASDAGLEILKAGGNAIDAAVAVGFALAVTYPQAGNLGGGGFMLVRMHTGASHFIDYREEAPAAASANMYLDEHGNVVPGMSTGTAKAIGIPGTVAGLAYAEKTYGKLGLARVMAPAIRLATEGYILPEEVANTMATSKALARFPDSRHLFQRDGDPYKSGELWKQPVLAATLNRIAANPDTFYHGDMARELTGAILKNGGLINEADLAAYKVQDRTPLTGHYRGYEILTSPPPSSGGITLIEILNILSGYDLHKLGPDRSPAQVHTIVEAFRRAYMDRNEYLGDPDFVSMPLTQLASPAYAAAWRASIDPVKASPSATLVRPSGFLPPPPTTGDTVHESHQTTQFSVVDSEGNAVSNTYTLNGFYGSGVLAGNLGFVLNNEMDDFTSKPGAPNMFHLIQGPANAIAPHKRPLSSMTPTIVLQNGKPLLVTGSPGGSTIITTVANDIISILDNGLNVQEAADAPRFHHQFQPDIIQGDRWFPVSVLNTLGADGYPSNRTDVADGKDPGVWGDVESIYIDPKTHVIQGADDQRHHFGKAAGY